VARQRGARRFARGPRGSEAAGRCSCSGQQTRSTRPGAEHGVAPGACGRSGDGSHGCGNGECGRSSLASGTDRPARTGFAAGNPAAVDDGRAGVGGCSCNDNAALRTRVGGGRAVRACVGGGRPAIARRVDEDRRLFGPCSRGHGAGRSFGGDGTVCPGDLAATAALATDTGAANARRSDAVAVSATAWLEPATRGSLDRGCCGRAFGCRK
jgi:hypothetical protein